MPDRRRLHVVEFVENLALGGLEVLAVDLAVELQNRGHRLSCYCLEGAGPLAAKLESAGIPVVAFHKSPGLSPRTVWNIARRLKADGAGVIHGHNPGVHHYAAVAARIAGVPVCVNTRHSAATSQGVPYQERYFKLVEPFTSHVVFVADFVRRALQPAVRYPDSKCSVIVNGIPLDAFCRQPAAPGSRLPKLLFGSIGRLVPAKAHHILIDAFAQIAPALPEAELEIHGYGPLEAELRAQIARLGMQDRIRLMGRTTNPAATLATFDVFVLSSVTEGLPLVILEAMAAGLPVITTNVGGVPEVLLDGSSWVCPPGAATPLAGALTQAAVSPNLAAMGEAARALALSRYGIGQTAEAYEAVFMQA